MTDSTRKLIFAACAMLILNACSSIKVPNIDFLKLPEFKEEAENIGNYPDVATAPQRPDELRTDAQWDEAARQLISTRDDFIAPNDGDPTMSEAELNTKIKALNDKASAYKADDPESMSK